MIEGQTVGIIAGVVTVAGFGMTWLWKISKNGQEERAKIVKDNSEQRGALYKRLDGERDGNRETYRSKDVCDERHKALQAQLEVMSHGITGIGSDVKALLRKNGIHDSGD